MDQQTGPGEWLDAEKKQAMLAAIVNSSDDAIISKTLDGIIMTWNKGAENLFGYTEQEAIGKPILMLMPESRVQEEDLIIQRIMRGEEVSHFETIRRKKSGEEIKISLSISPIKDAQGRIVGASKIARDITRQSELEAELLEKNRELEKLNSYKDDFIGWASHELGTPLTTLLAYLSLIEKYPDRLNDLLPKAQRQSIRLKEYIAQLLDLTKIHAGRLELNTRMISPEAIISSAIETVRYSTNTHTLIYEHGSGEEPILADPLRLEQVIINLLTNAIKYSPDAKKVLINSNTDSTGLHITVTDFGMGIAQQHQKQIFNRFFRVSSASKRISGLGIGLHISRQIIEMHRGRIWVESTPKRGSSFHIEIPHGNYETIAPV